MFDTGAYRELSQLESRARYKKLKLSPRSRPDRTSHNTKKGSSVRKKGKKSSEKSDIATLTVGDKESESLSDGQNIDISSVLEVTVNCDNLDSRTDLSTPAQLDAQKTSPPDIDYVCEQCGMTFRDGNL